MIPLRILLVDDHDVMRGGLRSLLESRQGWEVCGEAVNSADAVEKARALQNVHEEWHREKLGGADGIRTHDLLDAIEARSQLRHGPTEGKERLRTFYNISEISRELRTQR